MYMISNHRCQYLTLPFIERKGLKGAFKFGNHVHKKELQRLDSFDIWSVHKMYKRLRTKDPSFRWTNVCKVNSLFNCVDIVNNFLLQITFETKNNVPNLLSEPKLGSSRCNRQNSHSEGGFLSTLSYQKALLIWVSFLLRGKQSETFIGLLEDIYWTRLLSFLSVYRSA